MTIRAEISQPDELEVRMPAVSELETQCLLLRDWRDADYAEFAKLNADPDVMRHFPATLTREQSDEFASNCAMLLSAQGWGLWAVEVKADASFIGFVGLNKPRFEAPFLPAVEIGWRLARRSWGFGYATEAARASLRFGFIELGLAEIVSFTAAVNDRSIRVMERLGMTHDAAEDFDHPAVNAGRLRRHVLYRLPRAAGRTETS